MIFGYKNFYGGRLLGMDCKQPERHSGYVCTATIELHIAEHAQNISSQMLNSVTIFSSESEIEHYARTWLGMEKTK